MRVIPNPDVAVSRQEFVILRETAEVLESYVRSATQKEEWSMDVRSDLNELGGYVSSIALYIRSSRLENTTVVVAINGFEFQCDLKSGTVTRRLTTNPYNRVSEMIGKGVSEAYIDVIMRAHSLAVKIDLIERIKSLSDPVLNKIISKHPVNVSSAVGLSEVSVSKALIMILGEIKRPFSSIFNFNFTETTEKQQALYAALKVTRVDTIRTYGDVDTIWEKIPHQFKPCQQQTASKSSKL